MKKLYLLTIGIGFLLIAIAMPSFAQVVNIDNKADTVMSNAYQSNDIYVPGEVLVKFKTANHVKVSSNGRRFASTSVARITQVLQQYGAEEMEQLLPNESVNRMMREVRANSGKTIVGCDLSQLYRVKLSAAHVEETMQLVDELNTMDEVEYAEPNYVVKSISGIPSVRTSNERYLVNDANTKTISSLNDPMFSAQWGLEAINIPALWEKPVVNPQRPVIAILDTGVETTHPDLAANIWQNENETYDETDSDENGFIDDIHGWNFIDNSANVEDDNGHGTHCAGIAAAVGDNQTGICGANPNAIIMPVKILDAGGFGSVELIIQGIDYAVANGADIVSLSLSTTELSQALEDVLSLVYDQTVIIAAAGNDFCCMISDHENFHGNNECLTGVQPRYPAASKYVLGVMATNESGELASFSNFDCDGPLRASNPVYYGLDFEDNQSYELKAPGVNILSTYIGGGYTWMDGTSMACPMAAGAISRLLQCKDYSHDELLRVLTFSSGNNIDMLAAYGVTPDDLAQTTYIVENNGVTMTFVKTSESTCQFGDGETPAIDINTQGRVVIPDEVHGLSVTGIGSYAFKDCSHVTEVVVPFNVLGFGFEAFKGCTSLEKLILTGWTQDAWNYPFDETNYENCTLYVNDRYLEYYSISGPWMGFIHKDILPYALGRWFFADVNGESFPFVVTSVSPKTVKFGVLWITEPTYTIETVDIPSEVLDYTVTSISINAFAGNQNLKTVTLPSTIETIDNGAFYGCNKLEDINIPEGVTTISDKAFCLCESLYSIDLPSSIEFIGEYAFQGAGLKSFIFPEKLTTIQPYLLSRCENLKHINIPATIKSIGGAAFWESNNLTSVSVDIKEPLPIDYYAFTNRTNATLYVPSGCKEAYEAAEYWNEFKEIKEMPELMGDTNGDGQVLVGDVTALLNYIVGRPISNFQENAADVNGDGVILIGDVTALLNIIVNRVPN